MFIEKKEGDHQGSTISVAKMDAKSSYVYVPELLQAVINEQDANAWSEIIRKIDYTYFHLDKMLIALDEKTGFASKIRSELEKGKILLFKPNLVNPTNIDADTHGLGPGHTACTEWPLIAALMRWFHDNLPIKYSKMALGEAASVTSMTAGMYNHAYKTPRPITTEAVIEGRSGDFYGGWGFYFVRKYLSEILHNPDDNPLRGYEESVSGVYIPPGRAAPRMMVYDLNKLNDVKGKARTVLLSDGENYQEITLPKVVIGGDPHYPKDTVDYPGAVLINVPRLKLHGIDLLTNAIKNLGIGLYPMEIGDTENIHDTEWKYSYPYKQIPGMKTEIPHTVWVPEFDKKTGLPLKDQKGGYKLKKTGGIAASQVDIIKATLSEGVYILHIVDAIQPVNINHTGDPSAKEVPEGLVLASEDPVALDLFCARYCFKNISREEAQKAGFSTEFLQKVPIPRIDGGNIVTEEGYDTPLLRYNLYKYAENRNLGSQTYHIVGWDDTKKKPLTSVDGHLGSFTDEGFKEVITQEFYYNPTNLLWGLQKTAFNYLQCNDKLTHTHYYNQMILAYDENGDGKLDYDEMGRDAFWHSYLRLVAFCYNLRGHSLLGSLKSNFLLNALWRYAEPTWNNESHDFMKNFKVATDFSLAYSLSKFQTESSDSYNPEMRWGQGLWPSMRFTSNRSIMMKIYGMKYPNRISLNSLYGYAFQYADKTQRKGSYTKSTGLHSDPEALDKYLEDVKNGAPVLDFMVYVPKDYDKMSSVIIPNIEETKDPEKIFSAKFKVETWKI